MPSERYKNYEKVKVYTSKNRVPKHMKQNPTDLKRQICNSTIIGRDFYTLFPIIERATR